jgi:hypothetical protein
MSRCAPAVVSASLWLLVCGVSASADTLRCQSVNGNLNCAGSGGSSCQTVNGKTVCVSGHGDVVQSFGNGRSANHVTSDAENAVQKQLEQLDQDSRKLDTQSDWLSIDRE